MAQLKFPLNPVTGQLYSAPNGFVYEFVRNKWSAISGRAVTPVSTSTTTVITAGAVIVPSSTINARPVGVIGEIWFDISLQRFEGYTGTVWVPLNETMLVGPTGPGVPSGGSPGQILSKTTSVNFDTKWITPATTAPVSVVSWEKYLFDTSLRWIVTHNKNTKKVMETLTDTNGHRFYASVNIIDENSFEVMLSAATAGSVDVIFG